LEPEVIDLRTKVGALKADEVENKDLQAKIKERDEALRALQEKLNKEEGEKMDLLNEKTNMAEQSKSLQETYNNLQKDLSEVKQRFADSQAKFEGNHEIL